MNPRRLLNDRYNSFADVGSFHAEHIALTLAGEKGDGGDPPDFRWRRVPEYLDSFHSPTPSNEVVETKSLGPLHACRGACPAKAAVWNNPLSYTDPSGFFLSGLFHKIGNFFRSIGRSIGRVARSSIFRAVLQIIACAGPQAAPGSPEAYPPTRSAAMQAPTTHSNTRRKISLS